MRPNDMMKKKRTRRRVQLAMMVLSALSVFSLQEALAASKPDEIVTVDLLTVKEPQSEAESRLRVIRLTTRDGSAGYGDYLEFGLPAKEEEEKDTDQLAFATCPPCSAFGGFAFGVAL